MSVIWDTERLPKSGSGGTGMLTLLVGNLWRRWRERQAAKIDGRLVIDFAQMSRSEVVGPMSAETQRNGTRPARVCSHHSWRSAWHKRTRIGSREGNRPSFTAGLRCAPREWREG